MFNLLPRKVQLVIAAILVWMLHGVNLIDALSAAEDISKNVEEDKLR